MSGLLHGVDVSDEPVTPESQRRHSPMTLRQKTDWHQLSVINFKFCIDIYMHQMYKIHDKYTPQYFITHGSSRSLEFVATIQNDIFMTLPLYWIYICDFTLWISWVYHNKYTQVCALLSLGIGWFESYSSGLRHCHRDLASQTTLKDMDE